MTHTMTKPSSHVAPSVCENAAPPYETFLWLELIAFDNSQPDMGVRAYLDNLGFMPTGLSIFMWGPDFVHQHNGVASDAEFPADIGAYLDVFSFDKKQPGPPWRRFQLKRVIDEFHRYGVEVYFSIFPNSMGNRFHKEWLSDNPEVEVIPLADYTPWFPMLHPLKRMKDGSYYEDFFVQKIKEVSKDYGFDGIHLVDGYNHGWYQLCDAEFSDDMVEQFLKHSAVKLPGSFPATCGLVKPDIAKRAAWIWRNRRREWIDFHVDRWETYFRKVVSTMHGCGKKVAANTCWTRDPVESIYRYGIDYKRIAATGVDRFVVETCGAGGELLNRVCRARFSVPFFHVIKATSLMTRAYVPEMNICFNNCTQDITEGWSVIRQAPAFLEREIYSYVNLYHYDTNGTPKRVFDGLNVCLAAGMEGHEWRWLHERWESAFGTQPESVGGVTLVYSDEALHNELDYYLKTRGNLACQVLYQLSSVGVPIAATVNASDAAAVSGPLLVVNPHLFPKTQLDCIFERRSSPVFTIGAEAIPGRTPDFYCSDIAVNQPLILAVYNARPSFDVKIEADALTPVPEDLTSIKEAPSFFDELYYRPVSPAFYQACAKVIDAVIERPLRLDLEDFPAGEWVGVQSFRIGDQIQRCFIWNEEWQYVDTRLKADRSIREVRAVSKFRGRRITVFDNEEETWTAPSTGGHRFIVRIPPKGVGVVDLVLEDKT